MMDIPTKTNEVKSAERLLDQQVRDLAGILATIGDKICLVMSSLVSISVVILHGEWEVSMQRKYTASRFLKSVLWIGSCFGFVGFIAYQNIMYFNFQKIAYKIVKTPQHGLIKCLTDEDMPKYEKEIQKYKSFHFFEEEDNQNNEPAA